MRALIIEDDRANQYLLEQFLKPYASTAVASNGDEGLSQFKAALDRQVPFDLICLDIMMPGTDGMEVLKLVRKEEAERGIVGVEGAKVIMITAVADKEVVIKAFRDGCEAFLIKPLNPEDLIRNLKALKLISADSSDQQIRKK